MSDLNYASICRHVAIAVGLDSEEQQQYLQRIQAAEPKIAAEIIRLVRSDQRAAAIDFLKIDQELTPTLVVSTPVDLADDPEAIHGAPTIEGYRIIGTLGKGGMGSVYRAFHSDSDRDVALKIVHMGLQSDDELLFRFRNEARAAASLQHENIVPVYDVGECNGMPYFTMAMVEGATLQSQLQAGPLQPRDAAELLKVLAGAIQYAHDRGIVHRDLKPGNVLIDQDAKAWIADFGIAKRLNDGQGQTQTGQIVGSVSYISPEQIDRQERVGPRSDVYGLGAVLYHCLTGRPPFDGSDIVRTLSDVKQRMPPSPREINDAVDGDLESICMKCLQKEPDDRYQSASALSADLDHFLKGEPLVDKSSSWIGSLAKALKHRDRSADLRSSGAARWTLITTVPMHLIILALIVNDQSNLWLWLTLGLGSVAHAIVGYHFHWSQYWQLQVIERQSGIVQFSVNLAFLSLFLISGPLSLSEPISRFLEVYAPLTVVVGVATFAHAGHSGRWMLSGALCFPVSVLINCYPFAGPVLLSIVSAIILMQADRELRRSVSRRDDPE